jgi:hypothetical protein
MSDRGHTWEGAGDEIPAMICANCGRGILPGDGVTIDTHSEATGPVCEIGQSTVVRPILLCAKCAESRKTLLPYILFMILLATAALTAFSFILKW